MPATYEWVEEETMVKPESTRLVSVPAKYKTVTVHKLVKPEATSMVEIPEKYETVKRRRMVKEGYVEWRPVLCETNMTPEAARRIQTALQQAGFSPGPIDGVVGFETMSAVKRYQRSKGLATGGLTIKTLESLNVSL